MISETSKDFNYNLFKSEGYLFLAPSLIYFCFLKFHRFPFWECCHIWPQPTNQLDPASAGQLGPPVALFSPTRPPVRPAVHMQNFETQVIVK